MEAPSDEGSATSRPHVVLVGMMGAGKTTVGRLLAARLERPFLDSDEAIEARTGRTVAQIFEHDGEPAFRRLETDALVEMLERDEPAVIAAAGGTVLDEQNRSRMRARAIVMWLRVDPQLLAERVGSGGHRPLLENDPAGTLVRMAAERDGLYRAVAHDVIDVGHQSVDQVVDRIAASDGVAA